MQIIEVAPRDGLQNETTHISTEAKLELIRRQIDAGIRRIEITSFVSPRHVPQMADAEDVVAGLPDDEMVSYIGLALNERGVDRALAAGVDEINFVVVATDTFNRRNQGVDTADSIRAFRSLADRIRSGGVAPTVTIAAAFGCPFEGDVALARVVEVAERVADSGPQEIALADTIGVGVPTQVNALVESVREVTAEIPLRCHFHNTRNTGLANAYAAAAAGVEALDASLGGIGGCPFAPAATGNVPTEDLAYMLQRMGVVDGLDLPMLVANAGWLGVQLGGIVPGLLSRAGIFPPNETGARPWMDGPSSERTTT